MPRETDSTGKSFDLTVLPNENMKIFQDLVYRYLTVHGRSFPWRNTFDPYRILVSEIMLQQTQTSRVTGKYERFIEAFPDFASLTHAELNDVLALWQGLGYNRRALALKKLAEIVVRDYGGELPDSLGALTALPGIGKATAGSILAFAFNKPIPFIETNIRRVFIHFFFQDRRGITDSEILPLVEKTLDKENPRQWYYALMDYGAMLAGHVPNPNRKSAHYTRQSRFEGSERQIRGMILKALIANGPLSEKALIKRLGVDAGRVEKNLAELEKEGFLVRTDNIIRIS